MTRPTVLFVEFATAAEAEAFAGFYERFKAAIVADAGRARRVPAALVVEMARAGTLGCDIAAQLGVDYTTVWRILREAGVKLRRGRRPKFARPAAPDVMMEEHG